MPPEDDGPPIFKRRPRPRRDSRRGGPPRRDDRRGPPRGRGPDRGPPRGPRPPQDAGGPRRDPPKHSANPGRVAAATALVAVDRGAHVEEALPPLLPDAPHDRALAWHLALGVLRRRASVDAALRPHLRQPLDDLDAEVRAALRVGAYELLHARTPRHAAVDQAVEVARALWAGRASGLVNAVLRRAELPADLSRADALDHPAWLVARWDARYGEDATTAWCEANQEPPPLCLATAGDVDDLLDALKASGVEAAPATAGGAVVDGVVRLEGPVGRVELLPGFEQGNWWVQDAASAWMADLVPGDARSVLDACAAPGGKTFRLAAAGREVIAVDVSDNRLRRLDDGLRRLGLRARVVGHDWTAGPHRELGTFDAVLLDAPCTALGTVRRHPEIRWRRGPFDPSNAARTQAAMIRSAAAHVRPGGALVYVVCSPEPEEGPEVVDAFLAEHPGWTLDVVRTTAPPQAGEDAFWGARLIAP